MMTVLNKYDKLKAGGYGNFARFITSVNLHVPDTFHIPFLPSRQASSSQPLQLEVVGGKRPTRIRAASQPETSSKSKRAKGT